MIKKILIANRGEVAVRIIRACKELDIKTVAVHSNVDQEAMHVQLADESICIGPHKAQDSYLNIPSLISAFEISGADAIHPGYGFLSENYEFAKILKEHEIKFIGPSIKASLTCHLINWRNKGINYGVHRHRVVPPRLVATLCWSYVSSNSRMISICVA